MKIKLFVILLFTALSAQSQDTYLSKAIRFENKGELKKAEEFYRKAVNQKPHNLFNRVALGNILMRQKMYNEAQKEFLQVLGMDSTYALAYRRSGLGYFRVGNYEKALSRYTTGLKFAKINGSTYKAILKGLGDAYSALPKTVGLNKTEADSMFKCYDTFNALTQNIGGLEQFREELRRLKDNRPPIFPARWILNED